MISKRPRAHEKWRPFYRPPNTRGAARILTDASVDQAMRVVRSFFGFLRKSATCLRTHGKRSRRSGASEQSRASPSAVWASTTWPNSGNRPLAARRAGRCRRGDAGAGARPVLRTAHLGDPAPDGRLGGADLERQVSARIRWQGQCGGKVPLPKPVIQALEAVLTRRDLVLGHDRDALLFPSRRRRGQPLSRAYVHSQLKRIFDLTAKRIRKQGTTESRLRAARLHQASAHWLRHTLARTAISDGRPFNHVQKLLRHSSIAVTSRYVVAPDEEVAQTAEASAAALSGVVSRGANKASKPIRRMNRNPPRYRLTLTSYTIIEWRGQPRPSFAVIAKPGQVSVWDFPRPP